MLMFAYFLLIIITGQEWPVMAGPYSIEECFAELEFLVRRGYEVSSCEFMSVPQEDAIPLQIPYLPIPKEVTP